MKKNKSVVLSGILLALLAGICISLIHHFSGSQEENNNTEFANEATHEGNLVDELTYRKNLVIDFAKRWASEELSLSAENLSFEPFVDGRGNWRVNLEDNTQNIISSVYVNDVTGEVVEIITNSALESLIEINGMNIVLADYTGIIAELHPTVNREILETNIGVEEAGIIIAKTIHHEFNVDVDGSRFEMLFHNSSHLDAQTWTANISLNPDKDTVHSPHTFSYFHIDIDATTGTVLYVMARQ